MSEYDFEPNDEMLNIVRVHLKSNSAITAQEIIDIEKKAGSILTRKTVENALQKIRNEDLFENAKNPMTKDDLLKTLGITVKHDNANKIITFFGMLLAYTEEGQINISFRAPSATGKSYIPLELAYYFPDVIVYAGASPTSFVHDRGVWDGEKFIVDLERKIIIFVDMPHNKLLENLRPLLSHDKKELEFAITDRKEKYGIRTKHVILRGYPSVIFCSGKLDMNEQEATRSFILSPEINEEKIREGIVLKAQKMGDPEAFKANLLQQTGREQLRKRVQLIKEADIKYVIIPNIEIVIERFIKGKRLKPRHQRDIGRLISVIQAFALLNLWHREKDEKSNIIATQEDIDDGFELWESLSESQELGIPPYVFQFYKEIIIPMYQSIGKGLTRKDIAASHYEKTGRHIPDWQLRQEIIPALETAGLITQEPDPEDKRKYLVYPTIALTISQPKDIVSKTVGYGKCELCGENDNLIRLPDSMKQGEYLWVCEKCQKDKEA